jgi:hypothetical protein
MGGIMKPYLSQFSTYYDYLASNYEKRGWELLAAYFKKCSVYYQKLNEMNLENTKMPEKKEKEKVRKAIFI